MKQFLHSQRFQRLFKEGFWVVFGQVMLVLGSLVGIRILTGLMSPSAYGELALGMTVASLVHSLIMDPIGSGVTRYYAVAVEQGDLWGYLKAVRSLVSLANGGIVFLFLIAVLGLFIIGKSQWVGLAVVSFIYAALNSNNSILNGIQNVARQRSIVALHQGMEPWARFLVAAGLVIIFGATGTAAMAGYALGVIFILISQYLFFRRIIPTNRTVKDGGKDWIADIWNFSWPLTTWGIFSWAQVASDRWALGLFSTTHDVGMYAVLYQLGYYPVLLVTGMAVQFLSPIFYQRAGDGTDGQRNANVAKLSWYLMGLSFGITFVAVFLAFFLNRQIFHIFVAKEYASVSYLLPWMLLSGGISAASQTFTLNLMSQMKINEMAKARIITPILGVVFNIVGACWYGTKGVVFASLLFSIIYFIWMALIFKKAVGKCR